MLSGVQEGRQAGSGVRRVRHEGCQGSAGGAWGKARVLRHTSTHMLTSHALQSGCPHSGASLPLPPTQEVRDLVERLLDPSPAFRLGCGKTGAADIKCHPWFRGFDWEAFTAKTLPAPYLPQVGGLPVLHSIPSPYPKVAIWTAWHCADRTHSQDAVMPERPPHA